MRADGLPSGVAVASVIASGNGRFAAIASSSQSLKLLDRISIDRLFVETFECNVILSFALYTALASRATLKESEQFQTSPD